MPSAGMTRLELVALHGVPLVRHGDDLVTLIAAACLAENIVPRRGDVLVVAQKIVSKAEGCTVDLASVQPSERAIAVGAEVEKDPRLVEVILSESMRIVRKRPGLIITQHRLGFVMANAGVDRSNVGPEEGAEQVLLLPVDPDASAQRLAASLSALYSCQLAVIVSDSFGRAWRNGTVGIAIGVAGLPALRDRRGVSDLFGRPLQVTTIGFADEIAAAASLLMGQAAEARPVILVRGLTWDDQPSSAQALVRAPSEDLFR